MHTDSGHPTALETLTAPVTVIVGHFGAGKSEIAVNLAFSWRERGGAVTVVDLDVVKPYFDSLAPPARRDPGPQVEPIRASLRGNPQIARYVGEPGAEWDPFPSQVEKVYQEQSGRRLTSVVEPQPDARRAHARAHGLALA